MAGNRGIYNAAVQKAQTHARKQEWSAALKEYQRAVAEFPDDLDARLGIGAAYSGLQRWKEALELYQELQKAYPEDPGIMERLAETFLQLKNMDQVRDIYLRLSDQYVVHRKIAQAIAGLERLSDLLPQDEEVMIRLAKLYGDSGDKNAAIRIQTERIRFLFRENRMGEAMLLCEETLKAAPDNRQVKELLFRLRREMTARKERGEVEETTAATPVASNYQLEEWARDASERQEQGDIESAIRLYEKAYQGGLKRGDVCYSLGLLYKETGRLQEATDLFRIASTEDEFALSSHYAMGECFRDINQLDQAAQEFEQALHQVELQTIGKEAVDDLIQMYEAAAPVRELDTTGLDASMQELVEASRVYLEKGLFNAAIDACCEVINHDPDYLPIHLRLAEVYERQDRPEMALAKYNALISTYLARGEKEHAIDVYQALLAISPDAVSVRGRLSDLLLELDRKPEAIQQLVQVAQAYSRMGQTNRAMDTFRELRKLGPDDKEVYLEYGLFLLKMDKPDAAVGELRRALQLDPQSPVALARLNIALAFEQDEESFLESLASVLKQAETDEEASTLMEKEYRDMLLLQDSPNLYYASGLLQRQRGQLVDATDNFARAYRTFGSEGGGLMPLRLCRAMAEGYLLLDRPEEAIRVLSQGLEWAQAMDLRDSGPAAPDFAAIPSMLSFYHWLAEAYAKAGRMDQAIAALGQAKEAYPFDRETGTKLADLYFRRGDLKQALAELTELVAHYEQKNQIDRALEILQHMVRLAPSNIGVHKRLSHLYIRRGYIDKGLEELETLAELQQKKGLIDDAVRSLRQMAEIFWTMGRHDRAYQIYDRIVHLAPDDVSAHQELVNLHILAGRLADALEEQRNIARIALNHKETETTVAALHQVLALDPQDRWALRELANLLAVIGEHAQALRLYKRLIRLEPNNAEIQARIQEEEKLTGAQTDGAG